MTKRRVHLQPRRYWTRKDTARLRKLYPHHPTADVAVMLGRTLPATYGRAAQLGLSKTAAYLASPAAHRLDGVKGMGSRFPKGHVPANKGLRRPGWGPGRMKETQFKKGHRSARWPAEDGYVKAIEGWGRDESIIEAARMSTGKGFQGWDSDAKLLAYLYNNKHATPFEMAGVIIEVKAPLFVFREWHRHRTQSYNEMSARYIPLPDQSYEPTIERIVTGAAPTGNRQAQGTAEPADANKADAWLMALRDLYARAQAVYELGLGLGVPKELARLVVPVGRYSRMRASANLRNWLAFLTLRMAPAAQWEIRQYANAVGQIIAGYFPRTWALFEAERANAGK